MTTPKAKFAGLSLIAALCAGFTLGLTAAAWAGFDEGVAAYHRGDYATALSEFRPLAEQGNARAQRALGFMYSNGRGVPQDYAEAMRKRPHRRIWAGGYSEATSPARKTMTTPKAKFSGLALIAALCVGFTLGLTAPAGAGLKEGAAANIRGDYATAIREWRPLAEQGNAKAQFFLGVMYDKGQGVPQDYAKAAKWYSKAAEQGLAKAQLYLGYMYKQGQGVPQDYAEALQWYRKAAEQGDAQAQTNLGVMYRKGLGVPQDYARAMGWYRKAAEQGHAKAQTNLGVMYDDGLGVLQDYVQAHMWFNIAASSFPPGKARDIAAKNRDIVAKRMTPAQIA